MFSETKVKTRSMLAGEWGSDDATVAGSSGSSRSLSISRNSKSSFRDSHLLFCLSSLSYFFSVFSRSFSHVSCGFCKVGTKLDKKELEELLMSYGEKRKSSDKW